MSSSYGTWLCLPPEPHNSKATLSTSSLHSSTITFLAQTILVTTPVETRLSWQHFCTVWHSPLLVGKAPLLDHKNHEVYLRTQNILQNFHQGNEYVPKWYTDFSTIQENECRRLCERDLFLPLVVAWRPRAASNASCLKLSPCLLPAPFINPANVVAANSLTCIKPIL